MSIFILTLYFLNRQRSVCKPALYIYLTHELPQYNINAVKHINLAKVYYRNICRNRWRLSMINENKIVSLRMERQHITHKADKSEYLPLYRDLQPGLNVYWNGFGDPPSLTFRADFDDVEFNRQRQANRSLVKARFVGGNLGWVIQDDLELFASMFYKPLNKPSERQSLLLELIECEGPLNIQQMKEETGMLVKEITPALHSLQEAFLIYEDQYDGEWDRGWYKFPEMFPDVDIKKYTKFESLKVILQRFSYRQVCFNAEMAKSFYKLPGKIIKEAIESLASEGIIERIGNGWSLKKDVELLRDYASETPKFVYAMHRNDFLVKSNEYWLKVKFKHTEHETLQYLLIDGEFHGAIVGHFRNGPYDLEDVILDLSPEEADARKADILAAVRIVNYGKSVTHYQGEGL